MSNKGQNVIHGHTPWGGPPSPTYNTWRGMIDRCTNVSNTSYPRYGGRGISVCTRWSRSFQAFLEDMGNRPDGMTLERIDNAKGYEKSNCKWATQSEQARNTSRTRTFEFFGEKMCLKDWASRNGVNYLTALSRIDKLGWDAYDALFTPSNGRGCNRYDPKG